MSEGHPLTFTFGYNIDRKKLEPKAKELKWFNGSCSKCIFYTVEDHMCHKYRMISKPDQKCKSFKEH